MTVILPEYWPAISHVAQWYTSPEAVLTTGGTYQKQSGMNRCKIAGVGGLLTLSIPLIGGREQKSLYAEVKIDNRQRWAVQQLRTLRSCYGKAPFFDYYFPVIENVLIRPPEQLAILNQKILEQIATWLRWSGKLVESSEFCVSPILPPIQHPAYVQVFSDRHPFVPDLSILDAFFCLGPATSQYLLALKQQLSP